MSIWIITTGNSDVQLNTKAHWQNLLRIAKRQLDNRGFTPTEGTDNRFLAHARAMGAVYSQPQAKEYWGDLAFPLLDNFIGQIQNEKIDQIILILTNQAAVFSPEERRSQHHPYWQDTCFLEPILTTYLKDKFPQAELKPLLLQPESSSEGLDDWNSVLTLIQGEFSKLDFPKQSTIYVSHQAGTPAISSAVQFSSLAKFGERVNFLVSNERDSKLTRVLNSSTYLRGIRLQEAKALLERHDYSGVKALLSSSLNDEIKDLLDAAIQWNFAKFDEFAKAVEEAAEKYAKDNEWWQTLEEEVQARSNEWWWTAYESAYLGVVRLRQENTVEAMFHSFRAFEGLAIKNAERHGISGKFGRRAFKCLRHRKQAEWNRHPYIKTLIELDTTGEKQRNDLLDKRNNLFHQLQGFQKNDLFKAWDSDESHWQEKVLGCLNFVSGETFKFLDREESDGTVASLMVRVHEKLDNAITQSVAS
ncbi:MAG: hypothetical protein F6J89_00425 [Symploca sp. SIO1C4]|uniref:CRISPR-associated protein n=1 Tax=Symploca sp. SIO1C4 TaxID=2607765 RepID=A0A6B3N6B3_9CYAN|nr:hypothetical protein [Symploca sp. SIO1C4]